MRNMIAPEILYEFQEHVGNGHGFLSELLDPAIVLVMLVIGVRIVVIIFLAWIITSLTNRATDRWMKHVQDLPPLDPRRQRTNTVSNLVSSTVRYAVWVIALFMILGEMRMNIGPLLASAGVAGLAIGFGAQTLVRDVISGIFLLFDETLSVGNVISFGGNTGVVESIGLRLIKVRKFDGELLMVPAGELRTFGNRSRGFARVIVELGISYEQQIDDVLRVLERVARKWLEENRKIALEEEPTVQAISSFGESAVNVRVILQVIPGEQFGAERDLRLRIKREFDRLGVEIPFPRRTIYVREEKVLPPTSFESGAERTYDDDEGPDQSYPV